MKRKKISLLLKNISGRSRKHKSFLAYYQLIFVERMTPIVARYSETYILTGLTLVWSTLAIFSSFNFENKRLFLTAISILIFLQYLTDLFDGAVGRYKKTGLIMWGFYMDHLFDFSFVLSLAFSYAIFFDVNAINLFLTLALIFAFISHELLLTVLRNGRINVSEGYLGIGPTELRLGVIVANFVLMVINAPDINKLIYLLLIPSYLLLFIQIYQAQKKLWQDDMVVKEERSLKS